MTAPPCAQHPDRPAAARCAHCDRAICTECMIQAPVGWQCPACVREGAKSTRVIRPFADANHTGAVGSTNPTPVVIAIVVVNVICFVASGFGKPAVLSRFALEPDDVHFFHQYYRVFTAMFLHVNFLHIGLNMVTLLIVGPAVEVMLGKARFVALYLIAGLGGSVCSYLLGPAGVYGVGVSGAIFGVMGAYVVLAQRNRKPMAPVVILIAINLVFGFVGSGAGVGNVDWRAHIGGLVVGAVLGLLFDISCNLATRAQRIGVVIGASAATLGILAALTLSIAPGHVGLS